MLSGLLAFNDYRWSAYSVCSHVPKLLRYVDSNQNASASWVVQPRVTCDQHEVPAFFFSDVGLCIHISHRCSFSSSCTSMTLVAVRPNKLSVMDANSYSVTVRSSRHKRNFIVFQDSFRLRQLHTIFPFRIRLHSWIIKPLRFFSMWWNYLFRRLQKTSMFTFAGVSWHL